MSRIRCLFDALSVEGSGLSWTIRAFCLKLEHKGRGNPLMVQAYFRFLNAFALSFALFVVCSGASLAHPKPLPKPRGISSYFPLKMPRYEQWKKLPPEAQRKVIQDIQSFLLQADAMARGETTAENSEQAKILERLFDLWLETAQAKPRGSSGPQQPYCINQGVVKPIAQCDTSLGYRMHDFDTNEVLSKLGPASTCPDGEKPCSPFFGFTAEGQMFCSSKNLTRDCAQKSAQPGTLSLVNVMMGCEAGSPGAAKVDCKSLKEFFDQQMTAVEQLCQNAPRRYACGILKEQMQAVKTEYAEKKSALATTGTGNLAEAVAIANKAAEATEAAKMDTSQAPCPPETASAAAPSPVNSKCTKKSISKSANQPTLDALIAEAGESIEEEKTVCGEFLLPNQGKFSVDLRKNSLILQADGNSKPVTLLDWDIAVLSEVSKMLSSPTLKLSSKDLLSSYLPKEELKDAGKIAIETEAGKKKEEFPSKGWVTPNGTRIRYIPNVNFGKKDKPVVIAAVQPPGGGKEIIFPVGSSQEEDQEPQPKGAPESAPARQPK